jgi:hypothetical protein
VVSSNTNAATIMIAEKAADMIKDTHMIRHIVLIRFRPEVTEAPSMPSSPTSTPAQLPGILAIHSGRSESPEQIERGYLHGFTVDFADWDALAAYQAHPDHKRVGAALVAAAQGGRRRSSTCPSTAILVFEIPLPGGEAPPAPEEKRASAPMRVNSKTAQRFPHADPAHRRRPPGTLPPGRHAPGPARAPGRADPHRLCRRPCRLGPPARTQPLGQAAPPSTGTRR